MPTELFTEPLLKWYDKYGRKHLPWQNPRAAYPVWISEIMLQQTQVKTVIPFFNRFLHQFPSIEQLAYASEDEVLALWSGLGYYSRARNIHKTAQIIVGQYQGVFPDSVKKLAKLPGIGESTAAAITSLVYNQPTPILDGNVKRVLSRCFMIEGDVNQAAVKKRLKALATECMSQHRCADYTQAIMDLGATCCTIKKPNCHACPLQPGCLAFKSSCVERFPEKSPKKKKPVKSEYFIVLHRPDRAIYLEKRPPQGIWGGLWCLPNIDQQSCPEQFVEKHYNLPALKQVPLLKMKHTFTHFHLNIVAVAMAVDPKDFSKGKESPGKWYKADEFDTLGLASPVRQIINTFMHQIS